MNIEKIGVLSFLLGYMHEVYKVEVEFAFTLVIPTLMSLYLISINAFSLELSTESRRENKEKVFWFALHSASAWSSWYK